MNGMVQDFIRQAPFVVLATANEEGDCDASPKGGRPGFVRVVDERHLVLPDIAGNNLFQSYENLETNPKVGLLFLIPGSDWTVRVNGRASILDTEGGRLQGVSADVFDPFLGLAFGTRFREKAPVGSAIDELRVFKRDLTPVEIGFLHDEARAVSVDALADLLAATDARVVAARTALTDARARENGLATSVPQVLVMGEAPEPTPTTTARGRTS